MNIELVIALQILHLTKTYACAFLVPFDLPILNFFVDSFMTEVPIIQKPFCCADQWTVSIMIGTSVMKELIVLHHIPLLENKMNIEDRNEIFNLKNATTSVAF